MSPTTPQPPTTPPPQQSPPHKPLPMVPPPDPADAIPKTPRQGWRDLVSVILVLGAALVLAFGLISFVFQSYQVDGPSMQTTLQNNDHLIVWKVPRTIARLTGHPYIPNRGDVVIVNADGLIDSGQTATKQIIKRVIGLPGDRVVVKDNVVTIYNKQHPNGFNPDKTLPYGSVIPATPGNYDVTLAADQVFICGDNRPLSYDSRVFGPVEANRIVGKLAIRVLPITQVKAF